MDHLEAFITLSGYTLDAQSTVRSAYKPDGTISEPKEKEKRRVRGLEGRERVRGTRHEAERMKSRAREGMTEREHQHSIEKLLVIIAGSGSNAIFEGDLMRGEMVIDGL